MCGSNFMRPPTQADQKSTSTIAFILTPDFEIISSVICGHVKLVVFGAAGSDRVETMRVLSIATEMS